MTYYYYYLQYKRLYDNRGIYIYKYIIPDLSTLIFKFWIYYFNEKCRYRLLLNLK